MTPPPFVNLAFEIKALQERAEWYQGKIAALSVIPNPNHDVNKLRIEQEQLLRLLATITLRTMRTAK